MNQWRALVPIKAVGERKRRLAPDLSPQDRVALSEAMLRHVLGVLIASDCIGAITLLSSGPIVGWDGAHLADQGRGLNGELQEAVVTLGMPLLIIHADLPTLTVADIAALTQAGAGGVAIAPDRHGLGTNAIALGHAEDFVFAFGRGSLQRHRAQHSAAAIIDRPGLALDIDVAEDLVMLARHEASRLRPAAS